MKWSSALRFTSSWRQRRKFSAAAPRNSAARPTRIPARSARACPERCRWPTKRSSSSPWRRGWRRTAKSRGITSSTAKTIFTPTCPRHIRSASSICRSAETAMSISRRRRAKRPSASTKSTWRRTRASWCTTRGWMKRWWITTGAACRCWKSSPSRTCARRRK